MSVAGVWGCAAFSSSKVLELERDLECAVCRLARAAADREKHGSCMIVTRSIAKRSRVSHPPVGFSEGLAAFGSLFDVKPRFVNFFRRQRSQRPIATDGSQQTGHIPKSTDGFLQRTDPKKNASKHIALLPTSPPQDTDQSLGPVPIVQI